MADGVFLSDLKKGQRFTLPCSQFPNVVYTKGVRVAHSKALYHITWIWDGEVKRTVLFGYNYCKPVNE